MNHHASCVAFGGAGLLLRGPSGSGKSDLALRLIEAGAMLIADDQVILRKDCEILLATCPPGIAGRIEVRGLGVLTLPYLTAAPLALICDLVAREDVPRMPEFSHAEIEGIALPQVSLHAFDVSTVAKLRLKISACR